MKKPLIFTVIVLMLFSLGFSANAQDPDTDGDGIPDSQDVCPNEFWQGDNGCPPGSGENIPPPDADGDGVPDVNDQCPGQPGTSQNNGCPPQPDQPTPTPAPTRIQLPASGACVITPSGDAPVNVRAERSTDAVVITQLLPGALYYPAALIDGWYGLPDLAGWVRADVIAQGGDCGGLQTSDSTGLNIPTIDFTPDFANCGEIGQQANRVPVSLLIRFLNSADPCGGLTTYLRDRAFNPPPPPAPGAQALSAQAQCSSDPRPYPSPEALRYLNTLQAIDEELAANVASQVATSIGAPPGSEGDRFICALMRGDGFVVGTMIRRNTNEMGAYWTAMCVPPVESRYVADRYNALGFDPLPGTETSSIPGFIPPEAALIIALNDQNNALTTRTQLWCTLFATSQPTQQPDLPPERQAIIDWLIGCGFFDQATAAVLIHALNSGGVHGDENSLLPGLSLTWETLETIYAANGNGQNCPSAVEILSGVPRFRVQTRLPDTINLPAPTFFVGQIYQVQCDERGAVVLENVAPPGCYANPVYRYTSGSGSGGSGNPFLPAVPNDPFGASPRRAIGSLNAELLHYVLIPNFVKDPFEAGLAGVSVQVYQGFCSSNSGATTPSGSLIRTVTTDTNGVFTIEGLTEGQNYCAFVDAASAQNSGIFGNGSWYWSPIIPSDARITADTRTPPRAIGINFTAPPAGNIQPVRPYGWERQGSISSRELYIPIEFNTSGFLLDLFPDALDDNLTTQITVTVFNDLCNPDGWDGTPANAPPFCVTFPGISRPYEISADAGIDRTSENGITGVWVAIFEGSCLSGGSPIAVAQTDDFGNVSLSVSPTHIDQIYCAMVDANLEANAPLLRSGGWTTVSGSRIYYSFSPRIGRVHTALFPWWERAENVIGVESQPGNLLPIDGDAATATPEGETGGYVVNFNMILFDDHCDASGWDGNFRSIPEGCATWEPATLRANGTRESDEAGIGGVTVDLWGGTCTDGTPIGSVVTDAGGRIISDVPILFRPGEYCFVIDAAAHGNAAALQPGMWSATGTQIIRIPQTVDRDLNLTTTLGWWRTAPGSTPMMMDMSEGGIAPAVPISTSICAAGSICSDIPPRTEPIPRVTDLFPEVDPAALEPFATVIEQFGTPNGIGVFLGRPTANDLWSLYLYEGGAIYDIGGGSEQAAPAISRDGKFASYISRDENGGGSLMIMNLENGVFIPVFEESPRMRLLNRAALWSEDGRSLLIPLADENGTPSLYQLRLDDLNAPPVLVLANADDPAITEDGELTAFVRGGNVFIRFNATGDERQITQTLEGVMCDTPDFDTDGIALYFNCRQGENVSMFVQGFEGLQPITPENGLVLFRCDNFIDGVSVFSDGRSLYLGTNDASHLLPLVQIDGLQVKDIRWAG